VKVKLGKPVMMHGGKIQADVPAACW